MPQGKTLKRITLLATLLLVLVSCRGKGLAPTAVPPATPKITPTLLPTPENKLVITKYPGNYTSFKLETSQGIILVTDPYAMDEDVRADIVTVSHDHGDHADFARIQGPYQLMNTAGTFIAKKIKITGVAGHHNKGQDTTPNIIYIFDLDGIRLAQFASQGEMPTDAMFDQIGKVDILIIQIYGWRYSKLSVEEACQIAQRVQARIVIPAHTDIGQTDTLASLLLQRTRMGATSEKIDAGKLTVTQADLAAQSVPRVVVLDRPEK